MFLTLLRPNGGAPAGIVSSADPVVYQVNLLNATDLIALKSSATPASYSPSFLNASGAHLNNADLVVYSITAFDATGSITTPGAIQSSADPVNYLIALFDATDIVGGQNSQITGGDGRRRRMRPIMVDFPAMAAAERKRKRRRAEALILSGSI